MRDLIRNILREHKLMDEYQILFIDSDYKTKYIKNILESEDKNKRDKVSQSEIQSYADKFTDLEGSYFDKKLNQKRSAKIKIQIGLHFAERVFRDVDINNDERYEKVNQFEGVDVVVSNVDKIVQGLMTRNLKKDSIIKLKSKYKGTTYEILSSLDNKEPGKPPTFTLKLFNQIKGKDVDFKYPTDLDIKVNIPDKYL
jgi:hypothetical protein